MKKACIIGAAMFLATGVMAQKIDFNNSSDRTEDGYTAWPVGIESTLEKTVDGITFTITRADGSAGLKIMGEWWKDGVNKYSKLTSDGITVSGKEGDDKFTLRSGAVALQVVIKGLSAGTHSLMAYHNNPAGFNGAPLKVLVDGVTKQENVAQTNRAMSPSASGMSYVKFDVKDETDVTIVYQTVPDEAVDYTTGYNTTSLYINALVLDRPNPLTTAADPTPESTDMHAACDDGKVTLSWTAASKIVKHHVYLGTVSDNLTKIGTTTDATITTSGLSSANVYYWRVDEEDADGNYYEGDIWSFRPRRLAFPGAEGYGKYAIGGRGGTVYHVTSLDDDVDNPQPGTFRYGIKNVSGPRTIVFDIAGVITLKGRLTCSDPYVTIAGQTAPGRGIMFRGAPFGMASDGITRFIRARIGGGDDWDGVSPNPKTSDGIGMAGNDHAIMDHCSVGWSIDEAFSSRNAKNVTLQHTLISETLNQAGHKNYVESKGVDVKHGYAATIGGDKGSFHHNLLAHNEGRNWSMSGGLDGSGAYAGAHDMFNNVVYNWGGRATDGGTHHGQFVNNYYKMGPSTTQTILLKAELEGTGTGTQDYYVKGNIRENLNGSKTHDALNDTYKYVLSNGATQGDSKFYDTPFFESLAEIETAEAAFQNVLCDVGCNQPELDNHDQRMVSETLNGTTSTTGSRSGKKGLIDKESDSEGYDGLNIITAVRPATFDTDGDGIPDWYEQARGWSTSAANNNHVNDNDYTDLEEYLNWLAVPHFIVKSGEVHDISLKDYFAGYKSFTVTLSNPGKGNTCSYADGKLTIPATASGLFSVDVTVTSTADSSICLTRSFNIYATDAMPVLSGIKTVKATTTANTLSYNIAGMQVGSNYKGLVVKEGKKFINK